MRRITASTASQLQPLHIVQRGWISGLVWAPTFDRLVVSQASGLCVVDVVIDVASDDTHYADFAIRLSAAGATDMPQRCVSVSHDGSRVLTGSADRTILQWPLQQAGELTASVVASSDTVATALGCHPADERFATGHEDGSIRLWSGSEPHWQRSAHTGDVTSLAWYDETRLVSAGRDGRVLLHDVASPEAAPQLIAQHSDWVRQVSVAWRTTPAQKFILSASRDMTVHGCDLDTGDSWQALAHRDGADTATGRATGDGWLVASGGRDGFLRLWQPHLVHTDDTAAQSAATMEHEPPAHDTTAQKSTMDHESLAEFDAHRRPLLHATWHNSGRLLITAGGDNRIVFWGIAGQTGDP